MIVKSASCEEIKVLYDVDTEQILLGDALKIINRNNDGVIAQVYNLESSEEISKNLATTRILFSVKNNTIVNWVGNLPSKEFMVEKVSRTEILNYLSQIQAEPVSIGSLSPYNTRINFDSSRFEIPTLIFADRQSQRTNFSQLLSQELAKSNKKVALLDFRGEYTGIEFAKRLVAGIDFKLPLNSKGIESLYEKTLINVSSETRAVIEDIFMQVQDYADSSELGFIPFSDFKMVVDAEYEENGFTELVLLKNQLAKLEKQGIFANSKEEVDSLGDNINSANFVVVDLSEISSVWHKDFLESIIDENMLNQQNFFLIFEGNDSSLDENLITRIYTRSVASGLKPVVSVGYNFKYAGVIQSVAKNFVLFSPKSGTSRFPLFEKLLLRLSGHEALILGEISRNFPLIIQVDQIVPDYEIDKVVFELEPEEQPIQSTVYFEEQPVVEEYYQNHIQPKEAESEPVKYTPDIQPVEEKTDFEEIIIEEEFSYYEEQPVEAIETVEPQFNDDLFETLESYDDESDQVENVYQSYNEPSEDIYKAVDSLYTTRKEEPKQASEPVQAVETNSSHDIPIYSAGEDVSSQDDLDFQEGDRVKHQKYGVGVINKVIGYGNKKLCSIQFEGIGRRLLDPTLAILEKV